MAWNKLLSSKRETKSTSDILPHRNTFDMDYERIISSSSVRRLQDKAQVYPLQENDFTRTRLTHSLEVSSIGRSLGRNVGYSLIELGHMTKGQDAELSSLLAVVGLVHDLGNPPFGHYGEDIIHEWFKQNLKSFGAANWISDYLYFDGNAQTIRILSRLQFLRDRHGMNISYGTLGVLLKYPWDSGSEQAKKKKKFGYFLTEKPLVEKVLLETGMKNDKGIVSRHPATFLLEAADDIAYLFADLEDTAKKGYLPWEHIKKELICEADKSEAFKGLSEKLKNTADRNENNKVPFEERIAIEVMDFRVYCQGICILQVCKEFISNYDEIIEGRYDQELLKCSAINNMVDKVRGICIEHAYRNNEVLSLELIGKSVLTSLLEKFINAIKDDNYSKPKHENGKLFKLISPNFKYVQKLDEESRFIDDKELTEQERVQLVIDFISGMTDSYALNLHKTLLGIRLP